MTEIFLLACDELIYIAHKQIVDEQEGKARETLSKLPDDYLDYHLVPRSLMSDRLAISVARIILAFQITDFKLLRSTSTLQN